MKAIWNEQVIAESKRTVDLYGVIYFPRTSLKTEFFKRSDRKTVCPWKGEASYYDILVNGQENKDAAWSYPKTATERAHKIRGYVAFWKGVKIQH